MLSSAILNSARRLSYGVCGSSDLNETESTNPTIIRVEMMDEPPYEMNGTGLSERGKMPMTPLTLSRSWIMMSEVHPAAISLPVRSGAFSAILSPAHSRRAKAANRPTVPTNPSSSPTTAKMKSL
jgi:hypothetical protein